MKAPADEAVFDSAWLSRGLRASPNWRHGSVDVVSTARIGVEYGLSGRTHRVVAESERGGRVSFIVKEARGDAVERELLFHRELEEALLGSVPECYGGGSDPELDRGLLFLEDVAPAEQGDVLRGCTDEQAEAVVRVLARIHAAGWGVRSDAFPSAFPRWSMRLPDPEHWRDRRARATERYPTILTPNVSARLDDLPQKIEGALTELRAGPASWIHVDAHLDNVLWRPDGSAVLLDWCGAAIGPPAVDLARCLTEGIDAGSHPERAEALLSAYTHELRLGGCSASVADSRAALALGLVPLLQSAIAWAGRPGDRAAEARTGALRENLLRSVCAWIESRDDIA